MTWLKRAAVCAGLIACVSATSPVLRAAASGPRALRAATAEEAQAALSAWLEARAVEPDTRAQVMEQWTASAASPGDLLDRLARAIAIVETRAQPLIDAAAPGAGGSVLPDSTWLAAPELEPFVASNLRLWHGRSLAQREYYDEAAALLTDLDPHSVVDPAALLFYQAVVHQQLLAKEPGLKAIDKLLSDVEGSPRRYAKLAELLRADLSALEDESLDHIARRMDAIERHLGLGRADEKVRDIEEGVIKSLDKLIKELEEQAQQAGQSAGQGGGQSPGRAQGIKPSGAPAEQSTPAGGRGPGNVDPRDVGSEDGWGNLPPKQREEALQQIGQDFPAHYRDVIEQYFRKLADEGREN